MPEIDQELSKIAKSNLNETRAYIISLNCETDFVAKNDSFISLAQDILDAAVENEVNETDQLNLCSLSNVSISEKLIEQTGVIGEKLHISSFESLESEYI